MKETMKILSITVMAVLLFGIGCHSKNTTPQPDTEAPGLPAAENPPVIDTDADGDGIENDADNCWKFFNPDQADLDEDGIGDVCDDDKDGDGIIDKEDNCPEDPNPGQEEDLSGKPLACEGEPNGGGTTTAEIPKMECNAPTAAPSYKVFNFQTIKPFEDMSGIDFADTHPIVPKDHIGGVVKSIATFEGDEGDVLVSTLGSTLILGNIPSDPDSFIDLKYVINDIDTLPLRGNLVLIAAATESGLITIEADLKNGKWILNEDTKRTLIPKNGMALGNVKFQSSTKHYLEGSESEKIDTRYIYFTKKHKGQVFRIQPKYVSGGCLEFVYQAPITQGYKKEISKILFVKTKMVALSEDRVDLNINDFLETGETSSLLTSLFSGQLRTFLNKFVEKDVQLSVFNLLVRLSKLQELKTIIEAVDLETDNIKFINLNFADADQKTILDIATTGDRLYTLYLDHQVELIRNSQIPISELLTLIANIYAAGQKISDIDSSLDAIIATTQEQIDTLDPNADPAYKEELEAKVEQLKSQKEYYTTVSLNFVKTELDDLHANSAAIKLQPKNNNGEEVFPSYLTNFVGMNNSLVFTGFPAFSGIYINLTTTPAGHLTFNKDYLYSAYNQKTILYDGSLLLRLAALDNVLKISSVNWSPTQPAINIGLQVNASTFKSKHQVIPRTFKPVSEQKINFTYDKTMASKPLVFFSTIESQDNLPLAKIQQAEAPTNIEKIPNAFELPPQRFGNKILQIAGIKYSTISSSLLIKWTLTGNEFENEISMPQGTIFYPLGTTPVRIINTEYFLLLGMKVTGVNLKMVAYTIPLNPMNVGDTTEYDLGISSLAAPTFINLSNQIEQSIFFTKNKDIYKLDLTNFSTKMVGTANHKVSSLYTANDLLYASHNYAENPQTGNIALLSVYKFGADENISETDELSIPNENTGLLISQIYTLDSEIFLTTQNDFDYPNFFGVERSEIFGETKIKAIHFPNDFVSIRAFKDKLIVNSASGGIIVYDKDNL